MTPAPDTMEVKLKILSGSAKGREIAVPTGTMLIGRADECHLRLKSEIVSRRHAELTVDTTRVTIRDLGSRSGTLVNGTSVEPHSVVELRHGDVVKVGPAEFGISALHVLQRQKKSKVENVGEAVARTAHADGAADDSDVADWLQAGDDDAASNTRSTKVISAADLIGAPPGVPESKDESPADDDKPNRSAPVNTDQAAADMLKNYLRRR